MSKMDDMRAMREARYQADRERAGASRPRMAPKPAEAPAAKPEPAAGEPAEVTPASAEPADGAAEEQLCGHRNMSGRTCTREHGHAAKSHRYS